MKSAYSRELGSLLLTSPDRLAATRAQVERQWGPIPESAYESIAFYACYRLPPGSGMRAVLAGDLQQCLNFLDEKYRAAIWPIVALLTHGVPAVIWGSEDRVASWLALGPVQ